MQFPIRMSYLIKFVLVMGFALGVTSCSAIRGGVDDAGRAISNAGDDAGRAISNAGDDAGKTVPKGTIHPPDDAVLHTNPNTQKSYKVVEVKEMTDEEIVATIERMNQSYEIYVECKTGIINPQGEIPKTEEASFVAEVCNNVAGNSQPTEPEQEQALNSTVRVVQARDGYANLRSLPSTEVAVIATIPNGASVSLVGQETNSSGQLWYKVQVEGQVGWIYSELLK